MALELKFSRADRIYRPPDVIEGRMIVNAPATLSHQGIKIMLVGTVTLQPSLRSVGVLESLYTTIKPIPLINKSLQVNSAGKINSGHTEIPFRVSLDGSKGGSGNSLHDTYHGAHINIQYVLTAEISRGYMLKNLCASLELIIEGSRGKIPHSPSQGEFVHFYITQDTQKHSILPSIRSGGFCVTGRVMTRCSLMEPVVGEITVEHSAVPIRSIDVNLLRIESIVLHDRLASETTEVQATQVCTHLNSSECDLKSPYLEECSLVRIFKQNLNISTRLLVKYERLCKCVRIDLAWLDVCIKPGQPIMKRGRMEVHYCEIPTL